MKDVLNIQNNTAPNRFGLFVAEGLWAARVALDTDLRIDTFYWCPELVHSDEATKRGHELADRARRSFQVSGKTMTRMVERGNPDGMLATVEMPTWQPDEVGLPESALVLVNFARVGVPMLGYADSLNVSVSASVLLYEARARKDGW